MVMVNSYRNNRRHLFLFTIGFSLLYAVIEYYVIRDTTFGYFPVISLLYPYHFVMAGIFAAVSLFLAFRYAAWPGTLAAIALSGLLFSAMLVIEDFAWFVLRATLPLHGDDNAGRLIMKGEWTTQFFGSVDAHYTQIPNWYFAPLVIAGMGKMTTLFAAKAATFITRPSFVNGSGAINEPHNK